MLIDEESVDDVMSGTDVLRIRGCGKNSFSRGQPLKVAFEIFESDQYIFLVSRPAEIK